MGFLRKPIGISNPADDLLKGHFDSIQRSATVLGTPPDDELRKLAEARKGHISLKAVDDEYERLMRERYGRG